MRWGLHIAAGVAFAGVFLFISGAGAADDLKATTQPVISVSVNGAGVGNVYRGWPVIVEAVVANVDSGELQIAVVDAGEKPAEWALQRVKDGKPDALGFVSVYWVMDGGSSGKLNDGDYRVVVRAVHGKDMVAESVSAEMAVGAAPSGDDAIDEQKMIETQYASVLGHDAEAAQMVADWVKGRPQSVKANTAQGDLALMAGRLDEAQQAYQTAIMLAMQQSKHHMKEPPRELLQRLNAVMRAMDKQDDASGATPPAGKR